MLDAIEHVLGHGGGIVIEAQELLGEDADAIGQLITHGGDESNAKGDSGKRKRKKEKAGSARMGAIAEPARLESHPIYRASEGEAMNVVKSELRNPKSEGSPKSEIRNRIAALPREARDARAAQVEVRRIGTQPPILLAALRRSAIERELIDILAQVIDDHARLEAQVRSLSLEVKFQGRRIQMLEVKHECA